MHIAGTYGIVFLMQVRQWTILLRFAVLEWWWMSGRQKMIPFSLQNLWLPTQPRLWECVDHPHYPTCNRNVAICSRTCFMWRRVVCLLAPCLQLWSSCFVLGALAVLSHSCVFCSKYSGMFLYILDHSIKCGVCMYVCMWCVHVCMCVCMCICACVCAHHLCICIWGVQDTHTRTHTHTHTHPTHARTQDTFTRAKSWVKELQRQASPNIVIALSGNKADLAGKRVVEFEVCVILKCLYKVCLVFWCAICGVCVCVCVCVYMCVTSAYGVSSACISF